MRILVTGGLGTVGVGGKDMIAAEAVGIVLHIGPGTVLFVC